MKNLDCLIEICDMYKQKKYTIKELQSRIITASIPDNLSKEFLENLVEFDNYIEEIIYCKNIEDQEQFSKPVVDKLINAILKEKQRLS